MKAWTEMTEEEQRAAARKGDAVPLMPPADSPAAPNVPGLLAYIDDAKRELGDERISGEPLADTIRRLLGDLESARAAAKAADGLRRDIGDLRLALDVVPPGGASGDAPEWIIRLHRAACEVAGIGVREGAPPEAAAPAAELEQLRAMRDGLARLHEDAKRWLTKSEDRPNLRAAERRIGKLLGAGLEHTVRRAESLRDAGLTLEPLHPHNATCSACGSDLLFSARQRGNGLCGPCHRKATGTQGLVDRCRDAGIEPALVQELVLEILASPEGRAAIAECMRRPPMRRGGAWVEPRPGAEAKPGDAVRYLSGHDCGEVFDVGPGDELWIRDQLARFTVKRSEVEVVRWSDEPEHWPANCPRCSNTGIESVPADGFTPTGRRNCGCDIGRKRGGL